MSTDKTPDRPTHFIHAIVEEDNRAGTWGGRVVTRFPPEPNGYLHIGHAKAICLNHDTARKYGGAFHLRFDDTNPVKEEVEFVEAIQEDVRWLGCDWDGPVRFASDYFEFMYDCAVTLVKRGLAYVDDLSKDEIGAYRGSITEAGRDSPYRTRSVDENLDLLARMRAGEFPDGSRVLRAKIDMAAKNILLRDPLLYRIKHATHHRTGDAWCIYPMYDFAHCLEDSREEITHSLCTLEFETRRALYDWVLKETQVAWRPRQHEFARLNLDYVVMSKRYMRRLVEEGLVNGWDDPRLSTLRGMRRRGYTPEAIRAFCDLIGVARTNSLVDVGKLEYCLREDMNHRSPRVLCVLRPLEVVVTNYPEDATETFDAPYWPVDVPKEGSRPLAFSRTLYIDRDDFDEDPPARWHRLAPGREVRLRYSYVIRCDDVERDETTGEIVRLLCTYDPETRHGNPVGRRVKGTIHWVDAKESLPAEVRLYDRLFLSKRPGSDPQVDFVDELNPASLVTVTGARIERSMADCPAGTHVQFERRGYFFSDPVDHRAGHLVFNRVVTLRDTWAKIAAKAKPSRKAAQKTAEDPSAAGPTREEERARILASDPELAKRFAHYTEDLSIDPADADVLVADAALAQFMDEAAGCPANAPSVAKWVVNEVRRALKESEVADLRFTPADLASLVALVDSGDLSSTAGKEVFQVMATEGGAPEAIVEARGLRQVSDASTLEPAVDEILAANPAQVARYQGGKTGLLGFFVGQVMKSTGGSANPALVREILTRKLS